MPFFTYIVECADGTLYTGWTNAMEKRLKAHNSGQGARYTRGRAPVRLLAQWQFASKSEAMQFEYKLKSLTRRQKLSLIVNPDSHDCSL